MTHPPVALGRIAQIAMTAHDIDRATAFYRDALGMTHLFSAPPGMAFFDAAGVRLMLSLPEPAHDHPGSIVYFDVPDIEAAHAQLTARGVQFVDAPHQVAVLGSHALWLTFFTDTEGNTLALQSMRPVA